ncbi:MAG TPA: hypothetical protein VIZ62_10410 [Nitrososphaeraceae archaeon]
MNLNKVIIVIAFVTSILIISSSQISFAKKNDKEEEDDEREDLKKDIPVFSIDKTKKINKDSKETEVQNDILNDHYPNQYYVCGYPQQLITQYNSLEKVDCN